MPPLLSKKSFLFYSYFSLTKRRKEELDKELISDALLSITPEMVLLHSCVYDAEENEWIVCVASDADTDYPLFLICLKDGKKVYEEDIRID